MATARVRITRNMDRLMSCESLREAPAEIIEHFVQWMGEEIEVSLPPLSKPTGEGKECSSKYFWRPATDEIVENVEGAACFCEHMLEMD